MKKYTITLTASTGQCEKLDRVFQDLGFNLPATEGHGREGMELTVTEETGVRFLQVPGYESGTLHADEHLEDFLSAAQENREGDLIALLKRVRDEYPLPATLIHIKTV